MLEQDKEIETFVILDLETTDLPRENNGKTDITQFALYAFSAKYLLDKNVYCTLALNGWSNSAGIPELPKVLNKITLMVRPNDPHRTPEGYENESLFDEDTADCINNFLGRLKEPICLVAHNGYRHDYLGIDYLYNK